MRISLQLRAAILVCLAVLSIVIGKSLIELRANASEREDAMAARLRSITIMQGSALAHPLWDFNLDQVKAILGTFDDESAFASALVFGVDDQVVAERTAADRSATSLGSDQAWTFQTPIVFADGSRREALGRLRVVFSKQALHEAYLSDPVQEL